MQVEEADLKMQAQEATLRARKGAHERAQGECNRDGGDGAVGENGATCGDDGSERNGGFCDYTPPLSPGGSARARRLWQKVKKQYDLVDFHVLPEYLRDNEYILRHYRSDWPMRETLLSIFTIHNETLNIWTHLIGFILFLMLTIYAAREVPKGVQLPESLTRLAHVPNRADMHQLHVELVHCFPSLATVPSFLQEHLPQILAKCIPDSIIVAPNSTKQCFMQGMKQQLGKMVAPFWNEPATRWPFFVFMGGSMFCLLSSSFCHLLSCHSSSLTYWLWRLDYAGIAIMIATSFFPPIYYVFLCQPVWRFVYLTGISLLGIMTVVVSLVPVFQTPKFRTVRAMAFAGMGLSGIIPAAHKLISFHNEPYAFETVLYEIGMALFYGVGTVVYATRIPERWKPGCFDIAGHSHQIFHVLVIAGAYAHYKAGLLYLEWRDGQGCM